MRVSHRGLYALRALLHLAEAHERGGLVRARHIAQTEQIPEKFLETILVSLRDARLVLSQRGREGGYRLRRPPEEIVVGDVVRLLDGEAAPFGPVKELSHRARTEARHAGLFDLLVEAGVAAAAVLDRTTMRDLLERDRRITLERSLQPAPPAAEPPPPQPRSG